MDTSKRGDDEWYEEVYLPEQKERKPALALTLTELQYKLTRIDEISLMEILEITSEDIVNRFVDKIEDKYDELVEEFEETDEDEL